MTEKSKEGKFILGEKFDTFDQLKEKIDVLKKRNLLTYTFVIAGQLLLQQKGYQSH